jgi:hypothetical protein
MIAEPAGNLALLRWIVRADADRLQHILSDATTDMGGFLRFAHRHQLGAYAYWTLQRLGLARRLAPPTLAATKASSLVERTRSASLAQQLRELGALFARHGEDVLFIKGPLLAHRFYGSLDARAIADLDILLRSPDDLDRVEALLLESGFERAFRVLVSRRWSRHFAHHFEYRRASHPLDVHWALQRHFSFAIDYGRIWATRSRITFEGHTYEATSDEYELVLQILGVLTDLQVGKLVLRSLVDVYRILKTVDGRMDWDDFFSWRARERILRPSAYVLGLVLDVFDCRDEFARLDAVLGPKLCRLPPTSLAHRMVLESRPLDLRQKLLALRLYETSLAAACSWWLVSLPFRIAVYDAAGRPLRRPAGSLTAH